MDIYIEKVDSSFRVFTGLNAKLAQRNPFVVGSYLKKVDMLFLKIFSGD